MSKKSKKKNTETINDLVMDVDPKRDGANAYLLRLKGWAPFVLALGIPLILVVIWHSVNTVYPNDDCANYYETAQDIYFKFKSSGILAGLKAAYLERGWRPIFFPVMAVPFLFLTGGNLMLSVSVTLIALYLVFLTYVYLLARDFLSPWKAFLCTLFISTVHWIIIFSYYFMSEMSLMAASMGAFYHFRKCDSFRSLSHTVSAAIWTGIGFGIRPVEFFFAFCVLFVLMVFSSLRKKSISVWDLVATLPLFAITGLLFLATLSYAVSIRHLFVLAVVVLLLFALPLVFAGRFVLNRVYLAGAYIINLIVLVWWLPRFRHFYGWVRETTGVVGANYHDQGEMNFLQALPKFFAKLGGYPLLLIVFLIGLGFFLDRRAKRSLLRSYISDNLIALSMVLPPVFMLSLTTDITYRRAFIGFSVLLTINVIYAVHHGFSLSRLRLAVVGLLIFIQLFVINLYTFDLYPAVRGKLLPVFSHTAFPLKGGDPSARTLAALEKLPIEIPPAGKTQVAVFTLAQSAYQERPFDASALNVLAKAKGTRMRFTYPAVFSDLKAGYDLLNQNWSYAAVDITTDIEVENPYSNLTKDIIRRWKEESLEEVGLGYVATTFVEPAYVHNDSLPKKKILLLEILKANVARQKGVESILASTYLFPDDPHATAELLMEKSSTTWHAVSPPKYPEWVEVTFKKPRKVIHLGLRAQYDSSGGNEHTRGPKDFAFQASNDGKSWNTLLNVTGNTYKNGGEWKEWNFENTTAYSRYRVLITASGDPNLLTIAQINLFKK